MSDRIRSGIDRLDEVLGGGLPASSINLVVGPPGSGKTILAQHYLFANASDERPAYYLSTISEPFEKILRYGQELPFFDRATVGRSVHYEDLGADLVREGLSAAAERLTRILREGRPGLIVIDSFKALRTFGRDPEAFRLFLHDLAGMLSAHPVTSLWVGEYVRDEVSSVPEAAVADSILRLAFERTGQRERRSLQVMKLRGSSYLSGMHAYRLSRSGMEVFPRLADPGEGSLYPMEAERISSGIQALDQMLSDGYWPGSTTLVAGPTGAGKTLMGLHFIVGGARVGEPGIVATLQESPSQLQRVANGFGWSLADEGIHLLYRSPVDVHIDQWVYEVLDLVERTGARRIFVDSISDLQLTVNDELRFREYSYSVTQRMARAGISLMLSMEIPQVFGVGQLSDAAISHLSDNVVLLQYVRAGHRVRRTATVLKTRASHHDPEIRELRITPEGIALGDPIDPANLQGRPGSDLGQISDQRSAADSTVRRP